MRRNPSSSQDSLDNCLCETEHSATLIYSHCNKSNLNWQLQSFFFCLFLCFGLVLFLVSFTHSLTSVSLTVFFRVRSLDLQVKSREQLYKQHGRTCFSQSPRGMLNISTEKAWQNARTHFGLARQMEPFLNLLDLSCVSIWSRANTECLWGGKQSFKGDWANHLPVLLIIRMTIVTTVILTLFTVSSEVKRSFGTKLTGCWVAWRKKRKKHRWTDNKRRFFVVVAFQWQQARSYYNVIILIESSFLSPDWKNRSFLAFMV